MIITFSCHECGIIVKALVRKGRLSFNIIDKNYSGDDCLDDRGYFKCIDCHYITNIKFERVFS